MDIQSHKFHIFICVKILDKNIFGYSFVSHSGTYIYTDSSFNHSKLTGNNFLMLYFSNRKKLLLADQDVLNMVGSMSPWLVQPLPCPWNYHTWTVSKLKLKFRQHIIFSVVLLDLRGRKSQGRERLAKICAQKLKLKGLDFFTETARSNKMIHLQETFCVPVILQSTRHPRQRHQW